MADVVIPLVEASLTEDALVADQPQAPVVSNEANPFDEKVDKVVEKALTITHSQGLAIAVIDGDKIYSRVNAPKPWYTMIRLANRKGIRLCRPRNKAKG
jgi:hypothetical protein